MFNFIHADLTCPVTGNPLPNAEIQIKWQEHDQLWLGVYKVGDTLEGLEPQFDNTWIKTDFICHACSRHETGRQGKGKCAFCEFLKSKAAFRALYDHTVGFYRHVRCGILHQAETTAGWRIRRDGPLFDPRTKTVNATTFLRNA